MRALLAMNFSWNDCTTAGRECRALEGRKSLHSRRWKLTEIALCHQLSEGDSERDTGPPMALTINENLADNWPNDSSLRPILIARRERPEKRRNRTVCYPEEIHPCATATGLR